MARRRKVRTPSQRAAGLVRVRSHTRSEPTRKGSCQTTRKAKRKG